MKRLSLLALVLTALISLPHVVIAGIGQASGTQRATTPPAALYFSMGWDGELGIMAATATSQMVAPCTGKFKDLTCVATVTNATCTTGPTVNVDNVTTPAVGTAVSPIGTAATVVHSAETLAFTAGDTIALAQTATTSACTTSRFACNATLSCP